MEGGGLEGGDVCSGVTAQVKHDVVLSGSGGFVLDLEYSRDNHDVVRSCKTK